MLKHYVPEVQAIVGKDDEEAAEQGYEPYFPKDKEPDWEYPGQIVRDVAKALGIDGDVMSEVLRWPVNTIKHYKHGNRSI